MSKKLDEELAAALGNEPAAKTAAAKVDEGDAPGLETPAIPPARAKQAPNNRSLGLLIALVAMVGAVVALFMVGFKEAAVYSTPVDKLMGQKAAYVGRKVRVEGELVAGTLKKRDQPCEYRFTVHSNQVEMPVRYAQCVIPDTFRDVPSGGVQVTVEGALSKEGDFEATLVMAKCASKYDPSTHKMKEDGTASADQPIN